MILFNGWEHAEEKLQLLQKQVSSLRGQGRAITIASILFEEDQGSQLYATIKQEQARLVGIEYKLYTFSLTDSLDAVLETISILNSDTGITGIIIQKPWKKTWEAVHRSQDVESSSYDQWWYTLYSSVDAAKDVDGLHPETIEAIKLGVWEQQGKVLPATCQAVLYILEQANKITKLQGKHIIIGKSDLLGTPLYHVLKNQGKHVELLGRKDLDQRKESGEMLLDGQVVVSATGVQHLITGAMVADNAVIIDVGEPRPDVDQESVSTKVSFLTPVPGGVGPLTVACLLENAYYLANRDV